MLTYKFPLYPTKEQQELLWRHSLALNRLHNYFIQLEKERYEQKQAHLSHYDLQNMIPSLREEEDFCNLKGIFSQCVQHVSVRVATAYKAFFKKAVIHPPNFRSCRFFYSLVYPQREVGFKIQKGQFVTKQYGCIRFYAHRELKGEIRTVTVTRDDIRNKYYLCICTDDVRERTRTGQHIGIDLGITNFITTSDGIVIKGPTHVRYFDKQINQLKSRRDLLPKTKKGEKPSRNRIYLSKTIAKLHDVKRHKTNDILHKISYDLSRKYDAVMVEDIQTKKMSESKATGLNREIRNQCWSRFLDYLTYKTQVIRVNPMNTSKTCCICGHTKSHMSLRIRSWVCPDCGTALNRDRNAALNILHLGRAIHSGLYKDYKSLSVHDINPTMWMDHNLFAAKELALA